MILGQFSHLSFRKLIKAYSNSISITQWSCREGKTPELFASDLGTRIGVEINLVPIEIFKINDPDSKIITSPLAHHSYKLVENQVNMLEELVVEEIKETVKRLADEIVSKKGTNVEKELNEIFSLIWHDCPIDVRLYKSKEQHNILNMLLVVLFSSLGKIMGIDQTMYDGDRYLIDRACFIKWRHISYAMEAARLCILPSTQEEMHKLKEGVVSAENVEAYIVEYCKKNSIISSIMLKNMAESITGSKSAGADHRIILANHNSAESYIKVKAVFKVDHNGFGLATNLIHKEKIQEKIEKELNYISAKLLEGNGTAYISGRNKSLSSYRLIATRKSDSSIEFRLSRTSIDFSFFECAETVH